MHGVIIPKGAIITVMTGAANHDPRQFENPDRFDVLREPAHTGFGRGPHFCLGANLARAQGIAVLEQLVPHLPDWELADEPLEEFPGLLDFGYTKIQLTRKESAR
jgi:cytochrome P450